MYICMLITALQYGLGIDVNQEFVGLFYVWFIWQDAVFCCVLESGFQLVYQFKERIVECMVWVLEFAVSDVHQQVMFFFSVGVHDSGFQQLGSGT